MCDLIFCVCREPCFGTISANGMGLNETERIARIAPKTNECPCLALPCLALPRRAPCPVCSAGEKGTHRNRTCNALQRHQIIRFFYPFFANDDMEGIVVCICIRFWMPPPLPGAGKYWQTMNFKMPEVFRTFLVSYLCNLYILFLSC